MIKNLLEDIVYIEPRTDLPVPDGMCKNCNDKKNVSEKIVIENDICTKVLHEK
jgi:hypothetical protein